MIDTRPRFPIGCPLLLLLLPLLLLLLGCGPAIAGGASPSPSPSAPRADSFARFAARYSAVEQQGVLSTTQDELVWNFGVVTEDLFGRGGARWHQGEEGMISDVQKVLCEGRSDCTAIIEDVEAIKRFGNTGGAGPDIEKPVNRLMDAVLDWLDAHREPRPLFRKWPIR